MAPSIHVPVVPVMDQLLGRDDPFNGFSVLTIEVLDGQFARRKLWSNLNVEHESVETRGYAQKDLASLMRAINVPNVDEHTLHMLCNKPLRVRVTIKKDDTYGDKNEIKGFEAIAQGAAMPTAPSMPAANAAPAAPVAPWAKQAA